SLTSTPTQTSGPSRTPVTTPSFTVATGPTATATPTGTCGAAWRGVSSPNLAIEEQFLTSLVAGSGYDTWAVGRGDDATPGPARPGASYQAPTYRGRTTLHIP